MPGCRYGIRPATRPAWSLALAVVVGLLADSLPSHAVGVTGGPVRTSGGWVPSAGETMIYGVRLGPPTPGQDLVRVTIRLETGSAEGGVSLMTSSDILALRLYADDGDGVFDPTTDTFMAQVSSVPLGLDVDLVDPTPSEAVPAGAGGWFWVSIEFRPSALLKTFRVAAPVNNIEAIPPPPPNLIANGQIGLGASVRVGAPAIPVGLEWAAGLLMVGCGIYWLMMRKRREAAG